MSNVEEVTAIVSTNFRGLKTIHAIVVVYPRACSLKRQAYTLLLDSVTRAENANGTFSILGDGVFDHGPEAGDTAHGVIASVTIWCNEDGRNDPRALLDVFYTKLRQVMEDPRALGHLLYGQ